jgi:hypothetical protein
MNNPTRSGAGGVQVAPLQVGRDTGGQAQQHHISPNYDYDSYQSASAASNGLSMASTPSATSHSNEYNGETDVPMEDADPYNRSKYPSRPVHQRGSSTQYLTRQGSSAAQRYSPMDMLSPSGYASSPKSQSQNSSYQNHSSASRQSPTRQNYFPSVSQQYQESPSKSILSMILLFDLPVSIWLMLGLLSKIRRDTKTRTFPQYKVQIWIWIPIIRGQQAYSSRPRIPVKLDPHEKLDSKGQGLGLFLDSKRFSQPKNCSRGQTSSRPSGGQILKEASLVLVLHV